MFSYLCFKIDKYQHFEENNGMGISCESVLVQHFAVNCMPHPIEHHPRDIIDLRDQTVGHKPHFMQELFPLYTWAAGLDFRKGETEFICTLHRSRNKLSDKVHS